MSNSLPELQGLQRGRILYRLIVLFEGSCGLFFAFNPVAAWELCYGDTLTGSFHLLRLFGILCMSRAIYLGFAQNKGAVQGALTALAVEFPAQCWACFTLVEYGSGSLPLHLIRLLLTGSAAALIASSKLIEEDTSPHES